MASLEMPVTEAKRQAAHRIDGRSQTSRVQKKTRALSILTGLRDEGQAWLDSRPEGYDEVDGNADRHAEIETFVEELDGIIESLGDLDVPLFRVTV